jgi:hypothetical protein
MTVVAKRVGEFFPSLRLKTKPAEKPGLARPIGMSGVEQVIEDFLTLHHELV